MSAYYNEFDPYAAQWLRNLILEGHLPRGDVDERSIVDVRPDDLRGYTQCHFFAGIGGWPLALRMAGWSEDRPVWTGSCPCQPFSVAGKQKGQTDERHLWPIWFGLIRECHPSTVFGEQVSGAIAHGWLDDVYQGLEAEGYAVGSAVLPACSVGAPHKRDRTWFVADAGCEYVQRRSGKCRGSKTSGTRNISCGSDEHTEHVADATREGLFSSSQSGVHSGEEGAGSRDEQSERCSSPMANTLSERGCGRNFEWEDAEDVRQSSGGEGVGFWDTEPAVGRVANGVSARVGKLRALGNAIVPQVAQAFIEAFMECRP